jgi:hypothetical protein
MPKVVVTAQVEDPVKWEKNFRTHGSLFRSQTVTRRVSFATIEGDHVAVCLEPNDLDTGMKIPDSPATAEAMAFDGKNPLVLRLGHSADSNRLAMERIGTGWSGRPVR